VIDELIGEILGAQTSFGAFASCVGSATDENCFVTALVLLEVPSGLSASLDAGVAKALDFLEACEEPERPGAFRFYPSNLPSARLPIGRLAADADDTALAQLALIRHGRRGKADAKRTIEAVLGPYRVAYLRGDEPPWVRPGAVRTWLSREIRGNAVDCVV